MTTRTHNKLTNVLDFGAKGDGISDDTAAIQAALTVGARTVLLPAGTYPGGASYEKLRVNKSSLYLVSFWASFRNLTAAPISCNARLVKGTSDLVEIPGAYGAIRVQAGAATMVQASAIVSIAAGEDIKLQFSSDSASGRIDTMTGGLAAPSSDAKAGVVLHSLLAQE